MSQPPSQQPPDGNPRETFEGTQFQDDNLMRVHSQLMREKEEPTENFSFPPLVLIAVFMALAAWGGIYQVHYGGGFSVFHYDETKVAGAEEDTGPVEVDMMALGRRVYSQNCAVCHQADGRGQAGVFPPLVASDWVMDNPERLIKVVLGGLQGEVVVNGNVYNNAMTAFGRLSDQQIAAVLTYIRTDASYENNSFEVSEDLVAEVRDAYGARSEPWTQPELEDIHGVVTGVWSPDAGVATPDEAPPADAEGQETPPEAVPVASL